MRITILFVAILNIFLTSCGTVESSLSSNVEGNTSITFSGKVVDGIVSGAIVCLDMNKGGVCGSDEPTTTTASDGSFLFTSVEVKKGDFIPLIASGGVDRATGKRFLGEIKNIVDVSVVGGTSSMFVTPLSDLMTTAFLNTTYKTQGDLKESTAKIANAYLLDKNSVISNPVAYAGVFVRAQEIQQTKVILEALATKVKNRVLSHVEKVLLQREIKQSIVQQIVEDEVLDINKTLVKLEELSDINVSDAQKGFVYSQMQAIRDDLDRFRALDLNSTNIKDYQVALELEVQKINNEINASTLNFVPINIDVFTPVEIPVDVNKTIVSFSGTMVDGYISNGTVCMDVNINGICDADEKVVQTFADGNFSFENIEVNKSSMIPLIGFGGVDTAVSKDYIGELKNILFTDSTNSYIISPLTDLVAVDFLKKIVKDSSEYNNSVSKIATAFSLEAQDLFIDPMMNKTVFLISQQIEHIKRLSEMIVLKTKKTSQTLALGESIKKALVSMLLGYGFDNLDIKLLLIKLDSDLDLAPEISPTDKAFVVEEVKELKRVANLLQADANISTYTLSRIQRLLEDEMQLAYDNAIYNDINITIENATTSIFSKENAEYDTLACTLSTVNTNVLIHDGIETMFSRDKVNGINIQSNFNSTTQSNNVSIFFPNMTEQLVGSYTPIESTSFIFEFDEAWVDTNTTVYIKTPKNDMGYHECFRAELGSTNASLINLEKVYNYID